MYAYSSSKNLACKPSAKKARAAAKMKMAFHVVGMRNRVEFAGGAWFRAGVIPMSERRAERFSGCISYTQRLILEITGILWQRSDRRISFIDDPLTRVVVEFPALRRSSPTNQADLAAA
jgi:hypothetical protein